MFGNESQPNVQGEGADEKKAFASVNWVMTADELDLETQVALSFLDYLLTGTSASPLRKAITDSGLGESIVGGGMDDTLRQPTYSMGLKGVAPADVEKVSCFSTFGVPCLKQERYL